MRETRSTKYRCPKCKKGAIKIFGDRLRCSSCRQEYHFRRGVPILDITNRNSEHRHDHIGSEQEDNGYHPLYRVSPHSGVVGVDDPDRFLDEVEQKGWRNALENLWGAGSAGLLRAVAPNRVAWKYLLSIDRSWKALDIGSGTGGLSCRLAKECSVVALDKSWCDAAFVHLRAKQDHLSRLEAITADATYLPLESNQFDLATMIGSLEWIPNSWPQNDPRQTQLQALREIYRILKPGGRLFLGIENSLYLGYFLGIEEPHTNLKYISIIDKEQAKILSQDLRGRPYLEFTYSKDEYIELLNEAGFNNIQAFWLYPDYSTPHYIIPLDRGNMIKYFIEERLNPWDFKGIRSSLLPFYRFLDPLLISNHVEFYGFLSLK